MDTKALLDRIAEAPRGVAERHHYWE